MLGTTTFPGFEELLLVDFAAAEVEKCCTDLRYWRCHNSYQYRGSMCRKSIIYIKGTSMMLAILDLYIYIYQYIMAFTAPLCSCFAGDPARLLFGFNQPGRAIGPYSSIWKF